MSKIKFRIWDKIEERYVKRVQGLSKDSTLSVSLLGGVEAWDEYGNEVGLIDENFIIEQYTGINDKNQKEIYEGDILEFNGERGFVHFCAGAFFVDGAGPMYDHVKSVTPDILEDWVVIGNIYENSHLLDYK